MEHLSWTGKEYEYQEKHDDWYWIAGIIATALVIISILFQSYIFALVIAAAAFACGIYAVRRPPVHTFSITDDGVVIDNWLYEYERIVSFAVVEYPNSNLPPRLTLYTRSIFAPALSIPLEGVDPIDVYELLSEKIEEHEHEEPLMEKIMERFKF